MSGPHSRRKGASGEREIVALARTYGLAAERTWHTAQSPDAAERACDVRVAGLPCQVKRLARGFVALYDGVRDVEFLFLRTDGLVWLAVVRADRLFELLRHGPGR